MSKLINACVESILEMCYKNELTGEQLHEVFTETCHAFNAMAIIPQKRKLSRNERESLGAED